MNKARKTTLPEGYVSTGQAMKLLPLSRSTISRYLDSGKLGGTREENPK